MKKLMTNVTIMVLALVMMFSSSVFAAETFLEQETFLNLEAKLTVSNLKEQKTDLLNQGVLMGSLHEEDGEEKVFKFGAIISNSLVVSNPVKLVVEMSEPLYVRLRADKVTLRDNLYTYVNAYYLKGVNEVIVEDDEDMPYYESGIFLELKEPGDYFITFQIGKRSGTETLHGFIRVEGEAIVEPDVKEVPREVVEPVVTEEAIVELKAVVDAKPTSSKVLVNNEEKSFEAYNIEGNNFFKLRDLAMVLSGTEKQIEVTWKDKEKVINLISNSPYTEVGGEMALGDGVQKIGKLNASKIFKDGEEVALTAYNIGGNNYFKLRDIASTFDIGVTWDGETSTVGIDTSIGYVAP